LRHKSGGAPSFCIGEPGPQSASTRSRSPSPSTSPNSASPIERSVAGRCVEAPAAEAAEQAALRLERRADEHVGVAVAVDVAHLDHARQEQRVAEHLRGDLRPLAGGDVAEHAARHRRSRAFVVAAVGEQHVDAAVAVDVGQFDLVGPLGGGADRLGGDVAPQVLRQVERALPARAPRCRRLGGGILCGQHARQERKGDEAGGEHPGDDSRGGTRGEVPASGKRVTISARRSR
jgi:hypothetical protein